MHQKLYSTPPGSPAPARPKRSAILRILLLITLLAGVISAGAQAPTSLQYPTPNGFIQNVSSVYLAPTLAGAASGLGFTITPNITTNTGLSFNTATGVISGVPTLASAATTYTVTATNSFGSMSKTLVLTVTSTFFNNAYNQVQFRTAGGNADTLNKVGNGQNAGDIVLYKNVVTASGQAVDCIVKTVSVTNVTVWDAYDQQATTDNTTFNSNDPNFFSPQVEFGTNGGSVVFEFQFIASGTYVDATQSGTNITLQNVKLNTYDIDGNGTAASNQYNAFEGFSSSELYSATTLSAPSYDATLGLTKFESGISTNNLNVVDPATRVRLTYDNMSNFRIQVGAGAVGRAYFFLDYSSGPAFTTPMVSTPPTIDLNTTTPGTGNAVNGCATALAFSAAAQTNVASGTVLSELMVNYNNTTANIPDGANEQLLVNGATAGTSTYALNFAAGATASVTVGGVAFTVTKTVSGTSNTFSFTTSTTFTVAQAEALLDALRFTDVAATPVAGTRTFTVNVRNTQYTSPDAVFTATLNCVAISGNIWHDVNGQSDNTVNASATGTTGTVTGQFAAGATSGIYAVLTSTAATNNVLAVVPISAGGAFSFGREDPGNYNIYVSNTNVAVGSTFNAATYPAGNYQSTGENLGTTAGTDGLTDGKISVTLGSIPVTNANIGLQIPPVTNNYAFGNQPNPGGFNYYSIPTTATTGFLATDADGSVSTITITTFPTGANYLKVGSVIYTNGGTCPPQSACTPWPGTLDIPFANINTVAVDPALAGNTSVTITFRATDNGQFTSNSGGTSTVTIPFTVPATPISISGNVWDDANADGVKATTGEPYTAAATTGQTLYAILVQTSNTYSGAPTMYAALPVTAAATGYTFTDVPSGNTYEVHIASLAAAPVAGAAYLPAAASLATGYFGVSTSNNGTITANQNTNNLVNSLGTVTADKVNVNFGIEQAPAADPKAFTAPAPAFTMNSSVLIGGQPSYGISGNSTSLTGTAIKSLSGADAEDCAVASSCTLNRSFKLQTQNSNTLVYYSGALVTVGTTIPNFNVANLTIYGQRGQGYTPATALGFTYSLVDAAGVASPAATYTIQTTGTPLPVILKSFSGDATACTARLYWQSATESNSSAYEVEQSTDGSSYKTVATLQSRNSLTGGDYTTTVPMPGAMAYYRLKMTDLNGGATYSAPVQLRSAGCNGGQITVSPNPAAGIIRIDGLQSAATLSLLDLSGKMVRTLGNVQNGEAVDISMLPSGTYILMTTDINQRTSHLKMVKQ